MKRAGPFTVGIICLVGVLWGCGHTPILVFKDPETAKRVECLQERLRTHAGDTETRVELGRIFLSEAMIDQAMTQFETALNIDPDHIRAYLLLSVALQMGRYPDLRKAEGLLEKASQVEPKNADVRLHLGQIYNKLKEEEKAIDEFHKAIELSDEPVTLISAHLGLMSIYKRQRELEKADREYEAARKIYPDIDELIKDEEIRRITPSPRFAGEELRGSDDGLYPSYKKRIENIRETIDKLQK